METKWKAEAKRLYNEACLGVGQDKILSSRFARLVGGNSSSYADLEKLFSYEASFLTRAAELAGDLARK